MTNKAYMRKRMITNIWNLEEVNVRGNMGCQNIHVNFLFSSGSHPQISLLYILWQCLTYMYEHAHPSHLHTVWLNISSDSLFICSCSSSWFFFFFYQGPLQFFLKIFCILHINPRSLSLSTPIPPTVSPTPPPSTTQRG